MSACILCGRDHPPGRHDFSGMGTAVLEHTAARFNDLILPIEPIPAVQQAAADMAKTRRNGELPPDQPESLPQEVNAQRAPYRAPSEPVKRGPGRPRKARDV